MPPLDRIHKCLCLLLPHSLLFFKLLRVQPEDAGDYMCQAKNPVGSVEASAKLRVNAPPIFVKIPQNLRLSQGRTAVFECEASGEPLPGIFWSKEGDQVNSTDSSHFSNPISVQLFTFFSGLVSSDGRIQVTKEGRLIIDNVRQLDQGNYVCAAVNSAGSTLAKASLSVINDGWLGSFCISTCTGSIRRGMGC